MALTQVQPGMLGTPQPYNFKNRIINGAMVIDQRNAGASVTANNGVYPVDRFFIQASQSSKLTAQQNAGSVTPPTGFTNYMGFTSSSAYSIGSGDYFIPQQRIEGYNVADLGWGTANAKTVTLSFQVYSSLTGTFGGSIVNSGSTTRSYPFSYTISSANTWTSISITIAGDGVAGAGQWGTTNSNGMIIIWGLGVGSTYSGTAGTWAGTAYYSATGATSVVGTSGATFYITGVQLELGVTATSFDYRAYGQELALCQRYYTKSYPQGTAVPTNGTVSGINLAYAMRTLTGSAANELSANVRFPVTMRTAPTVTLYSFTSSTAGSWETGGGATVTFGVAAASENCFEAYNSASVGATNTNLNGHWQATAEL